MKHGEQHVQPTRTTKPPATLNESDAIAVITESDKDKTFTLIGFATSFTVFAIHDGHRDRFADAPPSITKSFTSTSSIRKMMDVSDSSKVFALVLQSYSSKGIRKFELSSMKMRSGFGKGNVKEIIPKGLTNAATTKFFNVKPTNEDQSADHKPEQPANVGIVAETNVAFLIY